MSRLHPLLIEAKQTASTYRVKNTGQGHLVWRFTGWDRYGWIRLGTYKTNEEAWVAVLDRLGLLSPDEDKPIEQPIAPTVTWHFGGYDLGDECI